jgi:hypothetical protein
MATTSGDQDLLITHEVLNGRYCFTASDAATGKLLTMFSMPVDQAVQMALTMTNTLMEAA